MAQSKKRPDHIRFDSERKGKVTSIRMSEQQYEDIKRKADNNNQSVSTFMVNVASNKMPGLTPAVLAQMQNLLNEACKMAERNEPDQVNRLQKEMNRIWHTLT